MTGSLAQLINGIFLLFTFFCCRLLWGTYQSLRVYQDLWSAVHFSGVSSHPFISSAPSTPDTNIMHYTTTLAPGVPQYIPLFLVLLYLGSNLVLNALNFYWFGKMIETLRKRFEPAAAGAEKKKRHEVPSVTRTTGADGTTGIVLDETEVRRRAKAAEVEDIVDEEEELPAVS
jgi:TLC domain